MKKLALRDAFSKTKTKLENRCYYYINILSTPKSTQRPKAENAGPIRSDFIDLVNTGIHKLHDSVFDNIMQKALTGDYAPKPNTKDIITEGIQAASPHISRLTPFINQAIRSPIYATGIAAIFGVAVLLNQNVRNDIATELSKVSEIAYNTSDNAAKKLSEVLTYKPNFPTPNFQLIKRG